MSFRAKKYMSSPEVIKAHYSPLYMGLMTSLSIFIFGMIIFLLYYYVTRGITHDKDKQPIYARGFNESPNNLS